MRRRAVVEVLTALKEPESRPRVTIAKTSDGSVTYSVTATGRSVKKAREAAQEAFREIAAFAAAMRNGAPHGDPAHAVPEVPKTPSRRRDGADG